MTNKHATRRDELILESANHISSIQEGIEQKRAAIITHHGKANEYSQWQRSGEARIEMQSAARLHAEITADVAKLKELNLERERIISGNHPELAGLAQVGLSKQNGENAKNLKDAQAKFAALLTPQLKAAAQRLINATKQYDSLAPVPALADMIVRAA